MMSTEGTKRSFHVGDIVIGQGESGSCAYIIEEGLVEVLLEHPDGTIDQLGTRGPGAIVGEMALVEHPRPHGATVRALKDCSMQEISRDELSRRLKDADSTIQTVSQDILSRYRDMLARADILGEVPSASVASDLPDLIASTRESVLAQLKVANEFYAALESRQLSLHYQPIVKLESGDVVGFEALMRWTHPEKGEISPNDFIPIAENSELIIDAGKWMAEGACNALKRITEAVGPTRSLFMSINVSPREFDRANFGRDIVDTVKRAGVTPSQIRLEITEHSPIQDTTKAKEILESCRAAGFTIVLDNFGTGMSSMSHLVRLHADVVNIDRSFVKTLRPDQPAVAASVVALAKTLKLTVGAEGVESSEQASVLREMGCDLAQGFYFARPMTEDAIIETFRPPTP